MEADVTATRFFAIHPFMLLTAVVLFGLVGLATLLRGLAPEHSRGLFVGLWNAPMRLTGWHGSPLRNPEYSASRKN